MNASTSPNKAPGQANAHGKQTRVHEIEERYYAAHRTLTAMASVTKLACFAAEARRTLEEIDNLRQLDRQVDAAISAGVAACNQWAECTDALGEVLGFASAEIESAQQAMDRAFTDLMREAATGSPLNGSAK